MAKFSSLPLSILAILSVILVMAGSAAGGGGGGSIHDLLRAHDLPAGLFPKSVESFSHEESTGLLEVRLVRPCYAKYDGQLAFFDDEVRGNLSRGELKKLVGLSQEELFMWLPVKGIVVDDPSSGVILFDILFAHKQLSLSLFESPPDCVPEDQMTAEFGELQGRTGMQQER